jgi:hypothetical protein
MDKVTTGEKSYPTEGTSVPSKTKGVSMRIISKSSVFFIFAMALASVQFSGTEASAFSSYFTTNCSGCHASPVTATCNGCHHHGPVSLNGTTNKTSYAPGESVSVTISGGSQSGWVRAILYDQNNTRVAVSSGNQSGVGSSTTFPAVLSAPAPAAPGTYTWKAAWYGNSYDTGNATASAHGEVSVSTNSFTVVAPVDATAPVVSAFTLPATATSLTVAVSSFTATDNVGVTGYFITTSSTAPLASAAGWAATAPTTVTAVSGSNTFYAWAKDAAGNVSLAKSATVTVTLPDTTVPVVSAFTLPATATSLTVAVSSFTATDNVGVTGYLITTSSTAPLASAAGWTATAPTTVTAVAGSNTFYAWAKDAAGNVSLAKSASVTVTLHKIISRDFDGDGKTDLAVWDPSTFNWFILNSATNKQSVVYFGTTGDITVSGDYDGDGKIDVAVWRPSNGAWYIQNSATGNQSVVVYGTAGDIPVPGDYDGDGKTDIAVFRPSNGNWYILNSTGTQRVVNYGANSDVPVPGDYDGDGKTDIAVWRPSNGNWFIMNSATNTQSVIKYGTTGDIPVPGDYDGDSKTDIAVWRNGTWLIRNSATGSQSIVSFGTTGDRVVQGDYDGIGRTETAVWRPAEGNWYILNSVTGSQRVIQLGIPTDQPIK